MNIYITIILVFAVIIIVVGLLLSSSGSTTGLTVSSGQDLELFKKTKDRGLVKLLQIIMYVSLFIVLTLVIVGAIIV
jgi:preprotein translocase subunit SecG